MALTAGSHGSTKALSKFGGVFSPLRNKNRLQRLLGLLVAEFTQPPSGFSNFTFAFRQSHLLLIVKIQCRLNRQDGIEQSAVARRTVGCGNLRWLGGDETFVLQRPNTLCNGVRAEIHCRTNRLVAGIALMRIPVLAVE